MIIARIIFFPNTFPVPPVYYTPMQTATEWDVGVDSCEVTYVSHSRFSPLVKPPKNLQAIANRKTHQLLAWHSINYYSYMEIFIKHCEIWDCRF